MTQLLSDVGGTVEKIENLGRKEFVRVTEKDHTGDIYLQVDVSGPATLPDELQDKVRLDKQVKRVMARSA
jgi:small subunit ribosomal protein S6